MTHPHEDQLLLFAYGDLEEPATVELERHLAGCAPCRDRLLTLERGRVALHLATQPRRLPNVRWAGLAVLAAAAALAGVLLTSRQAAHDQQSGWAPPLEWSATAGYVAGGKAVITIDAQLTRLEQGWSYGRP